MNVKQCRTIMTPSFINVKRRVDFLGEVKTIKTGVMSKTNILVNVGAKNHPELR